MAFGVDAEGIPDILFFVPVCGGCRLWLLFFHSPRERAGVGADLFPADAGVPGGRCAGVSADLGD